MPLLTELGTVVGASHRYKHGAPNGALPLAAKDPCKVQGEVGRNLRHSTPSGASLPHRRDIPAPLLSSPSFRCARKILAHPLGRSRPPSALTARLSPHQEKIPAIKN